MARSVKWPLSTQKQTTLLKLRCLVAVTIVHFSPPRLFSADRILSGRRRGLGHFSGPLPSATGRFQRPIAAPKALAGHPLAGGNRIFPSPAAGSRAAPRPGGRHQNSSPRPLRRPSRRGRPAASGFVPWRTAGGKLERRQCGALPAHDATGKSLSLVLRAGRRSDCPRAVANLSPHSPHICALRPRRSCWVFRARPQSQGRVA